MTGLPTSTGSPSKRRRKSGSASPTPWCTSFTWCRTLRCSGSSTRSTGTGRRSTATRPSRICNASWPSAGRACSRPTSSSYGLSTPRLPRCPAPRHPFRRRPARPSAPGGFRGLRDRRDPSGFSPCRRPGRSARTRSAPTRSAPTRGGLINAPSGSVLTSGRCRRRTAITGVSSDADGPSRPARRGTDHIAG